MPKDLTLHGPRWCHAGMSRVDPEHQPPEICGEAERPCHDDNDSWSLETIVEELWKHH